MAGLMAFAATRLPAADEDALILQGTAGTTLAQEQQALKAARRQSDDARDRASLRSGGQSPSSRVVCPFHRAGR